MNFIDSTVVVYETILTKKGLCFSEGKGGGGCVVKLHKAKVELSIYHFRHLGRAL